MPESSVHRALVTASLDWTDSLVVDLLASSIVKANACEQNAVKHPAYDVVCRFLSYCGLGWLLIYVFDKVYDGHIDCGWNGDTAAAVMWHIKLE